MSKQELQLQLYDSFKNRAIVYYLIFDEMRRKLGAETAETILGDGIYRRGEQLGQRLTQYGPANLSGLKDAFLAGIPDEGRMFRPVVTRDDPAALDIEFHHCPLLEAWQQAGLPDTEIATICRIAARIDNGMFEAAGFVFSADTWRPGADRCCLHIRPGKGQSE